MPATPVNWLPPFRINATTAGSQNEPDIIQLKDGKILVAWSSDANTGVGSPAGQDIIGQLFDVMGNAIGGEFRLNTDSIGNAERDVDLAPLPGGGWLAVYEDDETSVSSGVGIRLERYDALGQAVGGLNLQPDADNGRDNFANPRIAVASATSVLIVYDYSTTNVGNDDEGLRLEFYNPVNNQVTEISVLTGSIYSVEPDLIALSDGNYVISYMINRNGNDSYIAFQMRSSVGAFIAGGAVSGTNDSDQDFDVSATALSGGGFVLTWTDVDTNSEVLAQVFTAAGAETGPRIAIGDASDPDENRSQPLVTALRDGGFVIILADGQASELQARRYSSSGAFIGSEFVVTGGTATNASATLLADGRIAVAYELGGDIRFSFLDIRDSVTITDYVTNTWQVGTVADDTIIGSASIVHGHDGEDTIFDGSADNRIFGDRGDDTVVMEGIDLAQTLDGGSGTDTLISYTMADGTVYDLEVGSVRNGILSQQIAGFENIEGGAVGEFMVGNGVANRLRGGGGADTLVGGGSNDTLEGGPGADTLNGGDGVDTGDYSAAAATVVIRLDTLTRYGQYASGPGGVVETDILSSIENLIGGSAGDYLYGDGLANYISGGAGNDYIAAGGGPDIVDGGADPDFIFTGAGVDSVLGGAGDDTIYGGADNDTLIGGNDNDVLYGDHGADSLDGGAGVDVLFVDSQDFFYDGGSGIDYIVWQDVTVAANMDITVRSANYFYGFTGADVVTASGATVRSELHGAGGNDTLTGSAGVGSILLGEGDNDRLIGNTGIDHFVGGAGADRFVIGLNGGTDYIYDFISGTDRVEFATAAAANFGALTVITAYGAGGWYGYGYGTGTLWLNTTAAGAGQPAAGDFLFV